MGGRRGCVVPPGSVSVKWPAPWGWSLQCCSWSQWWWYQQSRMRSSRLVLPLLAQWVLWWASHPAGGTAQPGMRQPWSRMVSTSYWASDTVRVWRP